MRYGDTKGKRTRRGTAGKAGAKHRFAVSTSETFSGDSRDKKADAQGPSSIYDPWLCGAPFRGIWRGDDTFVEVVNVGITELSRLTPWASGAALPPATTVRERPSVPLWDLTG